MYVYLQEAGSYRPAVRPQRRREMVQELVAALPDALRLLASLLQQPTGMPQALNCSAYACMLSIQVGHFQAHPDQ